MPDAMPLDAATESASSTISSWLSTRSPSATTDTLQRTRRLLAQGGEERGELLQAAQVVAGQEKVDVRGGDHHPERARPELGRVALVRVHPHDAVAEAGQALHRAGQHGRIA